MKLTIKRHAKRDTYTIGALYIDGVKFCDTLEDTDRGLTQDMAEADIKEKKVYGNTAIPSGHYKVVIDFSQKYQRTMPHILNVKGFEGIRIHSGNTADDSLGCVLVGENKRKGMLVNSRLAYTKLFNKLVNADEITLDIV